MKVSRETPASSREQILDAAAKLFGAKGYDATSVREIGAVLGFSAPALYHHFSSKEDLFFATYERGIAIITAATMEAISVDNDPWVALEAVAVAHCEALLGADGYRAIISPHFPNVTPEIRTKLVRQRDCYETLIKDLIARLDLPPHIDPLIFRMQFLGSLNWTTTWFRHGGRICPTMIARQIVRAMRDGVHIPAYQQGGARLNGGASDV